MYLLKINAINADIFSANDSTSCIPMLYKMTAKSDALFIFVHLEELAERHYGDANHNVEHCDSHHHSDVRHPVYLGEENGYPLR